MSLTLLTREECELCEQMRQELETLRALHPLPSIQIVDVDSDTQLQRRYGLKIPVLVWDGVPICSVKLDREALLRALRARARTA